MAKSDVIIKIRIDDSELKEVIARLEKAVELKKQLEEKPEK